MTNIFDLTGKNAVVTGGTSGIGLGLALALLEHGARVSVWSRSANGATNPPELEAFGEDRVRFVRCDTSKEESVEQAFEQTIKEFGQIDVVVSNAGQSPERHRFQDYPTEVWEQTHRVNLDGTFYVFRAATRHMMEHRSGSLIAIASLSVDDGFPQREAYASSKSGVVGLVRSLAVEFGRFGIRANAILPGWIETPLMDSVVATSGAKAAGMTDAVMGRIPAQRFGKPADLAGIAVYLASDASQYHTGDSIRVDGGYSVC